MTPSRATERAGRKWLAAVIGPCVLGLLLVPVAPYSAFAAPAGELDTTQARRGAVNLRLTQTSAARLMAELSGGTGAAQESDGEKPKPMGDPTAPPPATAGQASAVKKDAPPEDKFAFVKDWPFWVIVGASVLAIGGGYMLLRNSNQESPCGAKYTGGCYP